MKVQHSVCPYDCPDACGLVVQHDGQRVYGVSGSHDHSFTRGTLCPKMVHYEEIIHSDKRILTPLRRIGKKGEGRFIPISWGEAVDEIGKRFTYAKETYGGESIMPYSFAGTMGVVQSAAGDPLFALLGATRQDKGICATGKSYGMQALMGNTTGVRPQEMGHSDCIVLWGINSVATNIHNLHDVEAAKAKGAQVWVIDTHETLTFKKATHHILIRPSTDGAFAIGVAKVLLEEGLLDEGFIKDYVQGFDQWKEEVLEKHSLESIVALTGVDLDTLRTFARAFGKARAPFIRLGSGLSRYGNGSMTVRCILSLPAIVGAFSKVGGGMLTSTSSGRLLNRSILSWDRYATGPSRLSPMVHLGKALTELNDPPVKCLYIYSSNPAITAPDQNVVRRGLEREDLFTVVHERFMTDTAKYADIVLPATTSVEHDDLYYAYGHYSFGCGERLITPIGESLSNWDAIRRIAKAMCLFEPIFDATARELVEHMVQTSDIFSDDDRAALLRGDFVEMTLPEGYKLDFQTPSGKIELWNPLEAEPLPDYRPPYGGEEEFWLINGADPRILDSSFCERDWSKTETMVAWMHPHDAAPKGIVEGDRIRLKNRYGALEIGVHLRDFVPKGTILSHGVWWQEQSSDPKVAMNALMSPRPTDFGWGSTFYDVKVDVERIEKNF